jgi:GNAT superfamily N-acetyltransferase
MPVLPADPPKLSPRYRPGPAGYLGYLDVAGSAAARDHANRAAVADQPLALLYNAPRHCDPECMYRHFLAFERDYLEVPGEFEHHPGPHLARDCHWQAATTPFRTRRAPAHYECAPPTKHLIDESVYCLKDTLNFAGFQRSLDETEETQRLALFSAVDPATPVGFFSFHRKVRRLDGDGLALYLLPDFLYVTPPYRGLGYGLTLVSAALEIWESELHRQASRLRDRAPIQAQIDAETWTNPMARRVLAHLIVNTREALDSCRAYWGTPISPLRVVGPQDGPLSAAST